MFCPKCGMKAVDGGVFCQKCGARLINETVPQLDAADPAGENTTQKSDFDTADDGMTVSRFDITLMNAGVSKIRVIAALHEWMGMEISEGKALLEKVPVILKKNVTMEDAEFIKHMFTKAGADVSFTDQSGQIADIIPHCRACGAVLDAESDTCTSCGHLLAIPSAFKPNSNKDSNGLYDSFGFSELWDEFMSQALNKKLFIISGTILLMLLLLKFMCSSLTAFIVISACIYFVYQYWGANYVTQFIYNRSSKELQLPKGMTSQTLLETLSGKFNYPYFKGVRYGTKGECLIDGKYAVYPVVFDEDGRAFLNYNAADNDEKIRTILREAMAVRRYINKFFNPNLPFDAVKELKALKSAERQRKAVKFVMSAAGAVIVAAFVLEDTLPGGLQYIMKPGAEVRQSYLSQYSESVTVEEAFENFFDNAEWSKYKADGYSYVAFAGTCEYLGERADVRVTFKITGENFVVDSLDVNGQTQNDLILYGLLSKVYENYNEEG